VLLTSHPAVKIKEQTSWIHHTRVKKAPQQQWKITSTGLLRLRIQRRTNQAKLRAFAVMWVVTVVKPMRVNTWEWAWSKAYFGYTGITGKDLAGMNPATVIIYDNRELQLHQSGWKHSMHQEECGQQDEGGSPSPLHCPSEASSRVLCPVLGSPVQER